MGLVTWGDSHEESLDATLALVAARTTTCQSTPASRRPWIRPSLPPGAGTAPSRPCAGACRGSSVSRSPYRRPAAGGVRPPGCRARRRRPAGQRRIHPPHRNPLGGRPAGGRRRRTRGGSRPRAGAPLPSTPPARGRSAMRSPLPSVALIGHRLRDLRRERPEGTDARGLASGNLTPLPQPCSMRSAPSTGSIPSSSSTSSTGPSSSRKLAGAPGRRARLEGRIVIVTGAASGIGLSAARTSSSAAHVVLADIDGPRLADAAASLDARRVFAAVEGATSPRRRSRRRAGENGPVERFGGLDAWCRTPAWPRSARSNAHARQMEPGAAHQCDRPLPAHEARVADLREQGVGGSLVYVASKNSVRTSLSSVHIRRRRRPRSAGPHRGARGRKIGVRANIVNPDAVFAGSGALVAGLRRARADAHSLPRTSSRASMPRAACSGIPIRPKDVAEQSRSSSRNRVARDDRCRAFTVDGGVAGAFPRLERGEAELQRRRTPLREVRVDHGRAPGLRPHVEGAAEPIRSGHAEQAQSPSARRPHERALDVESAVVGDLDADSAGVLRDDDVTERQRRCARARWRETPGSRAESRSLRRGRAI